MTYDSRYEALKECAQRMEDIACDCGQVLREPYQGDQNRIERYLWAIAVADLLLLHAEMKRMVIEITAADLARKIAFSKVRESDDEINHDELLGFDNSGYIRTNDQTEEPVE